MLKSVKRAVCFFGIAFYSVACSEAQNESNLQSEKNAQEDSSKPLDVVVARYDVVRENLNVFPESDLALSNLSTRESVKLGIGKHTLDCQRDNDSARVKFICNDVPRAEELVDVWVGSALMQSNISLQPGMENLEL